MKILGSSLSESDFPAGQFNSSANLLNYLIWHLVEYLPGDQFGAVCKLSLSLPDDAPEDGEEMLPIPGFYEIAWKR